MISFCYVAAGDAHDRIDGRPSMNMLARNAGGLWIAVGTGIGIAAGAALGAASVGLAIGLTLGITAGCLARR